MGQEHEYTSIRVVTLRGDLPIPFDAYIRVAGKYICYCRKGESFEGARLERLRAKNLKTMFVKTEDVLAYPSYLDQNLEAAFDPKRSLQVRAEILQGAEIATAEEIMENPLDEMIYKQGRRTAERFVEFIKNEPWGAGAIVSIPNADHSVAQHAVNVASLAVAVAKANPAHEGQPFELLALGAMLHDIEEYHETALNVARPLSAFTPEEMKVYRNHPLAGAHRFQGARHVDQLVTSIIAGHEEQINGQGYPKRLTEADLDPLVVIVGAVNAYDRLTSFESRPPKDALKHLLIEKMGDYPLPVLQGLQNVLKTQGVL